MKLCSVVYVMIITMHIRIVRLDNEDKAILAKLAAELGGASGAIRHALRVLHTDLERRKAFDAFLEAWDAEAGPVDEEAITAMAERYGL